MKWLLLLSLSISIGASVALASPAVQCKPKDLVNDVELDLQTVKSKYIYLDFWASWCEPCRASFPFMNELNSLYKPEQLQVIGISLDEKTEDAQAFLAKLPADFMTLIDKTGKCAEAFSVQGMPSSYILDASGNIVYTHQGFRKTDAQKIGEKISKLLTDAKPK